MNGFGLLIAVAALGVDVGWEPGPGGQNYYTVHIESLLLQPLREGQAIVSNVDPIDRNLKRYQIIVGEHAHAISSQPGPSSRDMVQHGWRPGENGGTDYLIQISPERLESLAKGSTIIGQIDPQVTDIRKLYVFSGVQQLPQQLGNSNGAPQLLGTDGGLRRTSGEAPAKGDTRVGAPQFDSTRFNGGQSPATTRAGDFPAGSGAAYTGSSGGPAKSGGPLAGTAGGSTVPGGGRTSQDDFWRHADQNRAAPAWPNGTSTSQTGTNSRFGADNRTLPPPNYPTGLRGGQTGFDGNLPRQQQSFAPPVQPGYGQATTGYGGAPGPAYTPAPPAYNNAPAPATAADIKLLLAEAKAEGAAEAKKAAEAAAKKAADAQALKPPVEAEKPWVPLLMTSLILFASLGTNLFLGWLAWSFFWRFRDAAGDATRAQTTLFPTRQAA